MKEISVGIRIHPKEGISFFGIEEVNALINFGGKVTAIEGGGAVMRKLGEDGKNVQLTLSGCDIKVILEEPDIENSPAWERHRRFYQEGCDLISPYMHLVGQDHRSSGSDEDRSKLHGGISLLNEALKINPANWSAHWIIGKAQQALGNSEAALEAFHKSYLLQKRNPDVAREYMFECLNQGQFDKAIAAAEHAAGLEPTNAGLLSNLALAYFLGGRLELASKAIENSLAISPEDEITHNLERAIRDVQSGRKPQPTSMEELDEM